MDDKTIYILIGPKGSGKSYLGQLVEQKFGIKFIRVEAWAKQIKKDRQYDDPKYLRDVFQFIEAGIRKTLKSTGRVIFESTGLTEHFDRMLANLKSDYEVITIGIDASDDVCINRVKSRNQTLHIDISDEKVKEINQKVRQKNMRTDFSVVNEDKTTGELTIELKKMMRDGMK